VAKLKNTLFIYAILLVLCIGTFGCSVFESSGNDLLPNNEYTGTDTDPIDPPPIDPPPVTTFRLEPETVTTIGKGQSIDVFAVMESTSNPFPTYIDPTEITWTSSDPSVAAISDSGKVAGMSHGESLITANYQSFSVELKIMVKGNFVKKTMVIAGQGLRSYYVFTPSVIQTNAPLVLSFHGGGGNGEMQAASSQLVETAELNNFIVAFPDGTGALKTFNGGACCGSAQENNVDDVEFAKKMIDQIQLDIPIDPTKIFSTGFSNGAILSHRLACELADKISGIAAIGGASGQFDFDLNQYYACNPTRPIPILHFHATNDRNYPIDGGFGNGLSATNFYPVQSTVEDWIIRNNLSSEYTTDSPSAHTTCYHFSTAKNSGLPSAPVRFCKLDPVDIYDSINEVVYFGGHSWPGGVRSLSNKSDIPMRELKASQYLWDYLIQSNL
jgi:polyhydroxybutyrate depolymerase